MFKKGFLDKAYVPKEKGDGEKKSQGVSDKPKVLNVIKKEVDFYQTKTRKSDVGSSSDSSKSIEVPENFYHIGGNTDLANAKVIFLADRHTSKQHDQDIIGFINAHAKKGDTVLVEGVPADQKENGIKYALHRALWRKALTQDEINAEVKTKEELPKAFSKWTKEGKVNPLREDIEIYGCDDMKASDQQFKAHMNFKKAKAKGNPSLEEIDYWDNEYYKQINEKDKKILETINKRRTNFPDKKLFVIAGKSHLTKSKIIVPENLKEQSYIILEPITNDKPTEKEREDYEQHYISQ